MLEKPNALNTIGLELGPASIKAARVSMHRGKPQIDQILNIKLETHPTQAQHVNPLYTTEEGKALLDCIDHDLAVSTLSSSEVLVRPLEIKLKKDRDIDAVLEFQAEPLLPYPAENAVVDRIKLLQNKEGTLLTLLAVRKDHLQHHLEQWKLLEIEPEAVSCVPAALAAFSSLFVPKEVPHFGLHLGYNQTTCIFVKEGKLVAAQSSPLQLNSLKQAFAKDQQIDNDALLDKAFETLDWSKITQEEAPLLQEAKESYELELARTLFALAKQTKSPDVAEIILTGEGAAIPNLGPALAAHLSKTLVALQIPPQTSLPAADLQKYAIPIGAALTGLPSGFDQINFRQKEFAYPHPWKRLKQPLAIYLALCLFLAAAFYIFGNAYYSYRLDEIRQDYAELLAAANKAYPGFEQEVAVRSGAAKKGQEVLAPPINTLSADDIRLRLGYLEKDFQQMPDIFPLYPNVPRVSDVLAWLCTNPQAVAKDPKTGALTPLIQIDSFSYTMVKRPELTKKQEKYQVKVELEFTSPNATVAREFHDALIAPNEFVDPKGDVKWSTNKGKYKATFFLKDKTVYPTGGG